jgi:hypothetical protein
MSKGGGSVAVLDKEADDAATFRNIDPIVLLVVG